MENPQEQTKHELTLTLPNDTPKLAAYNRALPIIQQKDEKEDICTALLSVWVNVRIEVLQMSPTIVPTASHEELGLIRRLCNQYGTITPSEFAECIRLAAIDKMKDLAAGQMRFPTLYFADFEEQIQKLTLKKMKLEENAVLKLTANTGGNSFWGEPVDALAREWPKIKAQTELLRSTINVNLRDRFWFGGSKEQQQAAFGMLRQMVNEMKEAQRWNQGTFDWKCLALFQAEYRAAYPNWDRLIENGMTSPIKKSEIADLKNRTERKISQTITNGGDAPSIDLFPDPQDVVFCAIFDEYMKFKL
jgi:hypothetical protein